MWEEYPHYLGWFYLLAEVQQTISYGSNSGATKSIRDSEWCCLLLLSFFYSTLTIYQPLSTYQYPPTLLIDPAVYYTRYWLPVTPSNRCRLYFCWYGIQSSTSLILLDVYKSSIKYLSIPSPTLTKFHLDDIVLSFIYLRQFKVIYCHNWYFIARYFTS